METQIETLTMEQAIERGYTHFVEEEGEKVIKFSSVTEDDKEYYRKYKCYIVDMNQPKHYSISADAIKDLVVDCVAGQEEMADEDDKLVNIAFAQDYSKLAEELNAKFSEIKYYEPIDIEVTF